MNNHTLLLKEKGEVITGHGSIQNINDYVTEVPFEASQEEDYDTENNIVTSEDVSTNAYEANFIVHDPGYIVEQGDYVKFNESYTYKTYGGLPRITYYQTIYK